MAHTISLHERDMIYQMAEAGWTDQAIAEKLGRHRLTVLKWRRRGMGSQGVKEGEHRGRPHTGPLSTFPEEVGEVVGQWRRAHPGWGGKTLRAELEVKGMTPLPSVASLNRWLRSAGLVRRNRHHTALPVEASMGEGSCHQVWQLDARGNEMVAGVGLVSVIDVKDVASRVTIMSQPCLVGGGTGHRLDTQDYQLALRRAFTEWGLPDVITGDHDSIFYDNGSPSPFPTRFHLWLVALGISLRFIRRHCPTQHAIVERSHQIIYAQALEQQHFQNLSHLEQALDQRRHFLNSSLPCRSLQNRPPLQATPLAILPRRCYRPEGEADLLDLSRVWLYLERGHWFRLASTPGTVALGGVTYCLGPTFSRRQVRITFQASTRLLHFDPLDGSAPLTRPIQGISVPFLMGDLAHLTSGTPFQLCLPFAWDQLRTIFLVNLLSGSFP